VRPLLAVLFAAALTCVPAHADAPGSVVVAYPASLQTTMDGPVASALRDQGIEFVGEPGGSKQLASLIASGQRSPDVFIAIDRANVDRLGAKVASAITFGSTRLGIAWEGKSNYAYVFTSVATGETPWLVALAQPGLRIGRTDPDLDPKGQFTIDALVDLIGAANEKRILGVDKNPQQIYPEAELMARLESGDIDVGFFYQAEAAPHKVPFWAFPGEASMSDKLTYTLAVMKDAPHPEAAQAFAKFVLTGEGSHILQEGGVRYATSAADTR
jgi:molybdate/tungstate transport system substrate-binding protein